jgi:hypothetical protein
LNFMVNDATLLMICPAPPPVDELVRNELAIAANKRCPHSYILD